MSTITPETYQRVRAEIIGIFRWRAESLTAEQALRLDTVVPMRLWLDAEHAKILRGEPVDMPKMLTVADAISRLLPPAALAEPPSEARSDPRERLWQMYMTARERGGISERGVDHDYFRWLVITQAEEENERLAPVLPDNVVVMSRPASNSAPAAAPGAEQPPPQPAPARAAPAEPTEPPAYDYAKNDSWRDYVGSDGTIRPTPRRGHDWGPV